MAYKPRIKQVVEVLQDEGYNPAEALVLCAIEAKKQSEDERYMPNVRAQFLTLAQKANSDLLEYVQPKLSRRELVGEGGGDININHIHDLSDDLLEQLIANSAAGSEGAT